AALKAKALSLPNCTKVETAGHVLVDFGGKLGAGAVKQVVDCYRITRREVLRRGCRRIGRLAVEKVSLFLAFSNRRQTLAAVYVPVGGELRVVGVEELGPDKAANRAAGRSLSAAVWSDDDADAARKLVELKVSDA